MTDDNASPDAVVIERSFDAPAGLIWRMWTEPEHFKVWYGPDGATIPVARMDVRVGGTRLVCMEMQTPGGPMQMWFTGEYREVVKNERLVYTESLSDENGNVVSPSNIGMPQGHPTTTEVTVELGDIGGRTKMVMTMLAFLETLRALPGGRWRSTSSPLTSKHRASDGGGHFERRARVPAWSQRIEVIPGDNTDRRLRQGRAQCRAVACGHFLMRPRFDIVFGVVVMAVANVAVAI